MTLKRLSEILPETQAYMAKLWFAAQIDATAEQRDAAEPFMRKVGATEIDIAAHRMATEDLRGMALAWRNEVHAEHPEPVAPAAPHVDFGIPEPKPAPRLQVRPPVCPFCWKWNCYVPRILEGGQKLMLSTCENGAQYDRRMANGQDHTNTIDPMTGKIPGEAA